MKKSLLLILLVLVAKAHAGVSVVGNGGDVIDCGPQVPLRLLDVYEKTVLERQRFYLNEFEGTATDIFTQYIQELHNVAPYHAKVLRKSVEEVKSKVVWSQTELMDIPDSQHVLLPSGCRIRQIAIQTRENNMTTRLEINRPLYVRLDEANKVALWMHEGIYAEAIDLLQENSIRTRALNGIMLSGSYTNERDLNAARAANGFRQFTTDKNLDTLILCPNGELCGLATKEGFNTETKNPEQISVTRDGYRVDSIIFPNGNKEILPGFNVYRYFLQKPQIQGFGWNNVSFDGNIFMCTGTATNNVMTMSPHNFIPGKGYDGAALVTSCVGRSEKTPLPSRFTKLLGQWEGQTSLRMNFYYSFDRDGSHPSGIQYAMDYGSWTLGFTPMENLTFNSYKEDWTTKQISLGWKTTGSFREKGASYSLNCQLAGSMEILMKDSGPMLLKATPFDPKDENNRCTVMNGTTAIVLKDMERNTQGELISGIPSAGALPFLGQSAVFTGKVLFKNNSVVEGVLDKTVSGKFKINGEESQVLLPPGLKYSVDENQILTVTGKKDKDGDFDLSGEELPEFEVSLQKNVQTKDLKSVFVSEVTLSQALELTSGVLARPIAKLPVCYFDASARKVKVSIEPVKARILIITRFKKGPEVENCFWTYSTEKVPPGGINRMNTVRNIPPGKEIVIKKEERIREGVLVCDFNIRTEEVYPHYGAWLEKGAKLTLDKGVYDDNQKCGWYRPNFDMTGKLK